MGPKEVAFRKRQILRMTAPQLAKLNSVWGLDVWWKSRHQTFEKGKTDTK